jgi:hypothetical protein
VEICHHNALTMGIAEPVPCFAYSCFVILV